MLLTEDKDFGRLVYANRQPSGGVIFVRFPANARRTLSRAVMSVIKEKGEQLSSKFVVLSPGRVRISGSQD